MTQNIDHIVELILEEARRRNKDRKYLLLRAHDVVQEIHAELNCIMETERRQRLKRESELSKTSTSRCT